MISWRYHQEQTYIVPVNQTYTNLQTQGLYHHLLLLNKCLLPDSDFRPHLRVLAMGVDWSCFQPTLAFPPVLLNAGAGCSRKFFAILQMPWDRDSFHHQQAGLFHDAFLPPPCPVLPFLIVKASLLWAVRGVLHILYLTGPLPETPEGDTVKVFYVGE